MTDEVPDIFDRLKPQPAPPELRARVLASVDRELARRKKPRWERALELGVAASLVLGISMNVWQWRFRAPLYDRVVGSSNESAVGSGRPRAFAASDAQVDQLIRDRLALLGPRHELQPAISQQYERLLKELTKPGSG